MATDAPTPSLSSPEASENFLQLLRYCRQVLGGRSRIASKRELSEALNVAPGMAGRYVSGETDFYNLRAVTVELLARACELDVGTAFTWVGQGREAAMAHEERLRREPVTFTALDHVRIAWRLLDQQERDGQAEDGAGSEELLPTDFEGLRQALAARRGPDGEALAGIFDTLVRTIEAAPCLERIGDRLELQEEDWLKLQLLLGLEAAELRARFGPGRTPPRSEPTPA